MQVLNPSVQVVHELRFPTISVEYRNFAKELSNWIPLNFATLTGFEVVREQFQAVGVRFEDAIAVHPSNPAFQTDSGQLALMPIAERTKITAQFQQPQRWVQAVLTGARQIRLTAYAGDVTVLTQSTQQEQAQLGYATPIALPQQSLELVSNRITKVTFDSPAPFLLSEFCYQG